jgi:hypothetical protein
MGSVGDCFENAMCESFFRYALNASRSTAAVSAPQADARTRPG